MRFDKPVLLYGAGREAHSTRQFLLEQAPDLKVFVTADNGQADIEGAEFVPVAQLPGLMASGRFGMIIKSPGVSLYKPIFEKARAAGIKITSNLNLWGDRYADGHKIVAITGTKGKSTTATLTHLMLVHSGLDAGLAGNVGVPPLDIADSHEIVVFELSSYQTADMDFAPDIAAVTTLYPEHFDWHGSTERYFEDKLHLLRLGTKTRFAFGPQAATTARIAPYLSDASRLVPGLEYDFEDALTARVKTSRLKGQHNLDNAILAARIALDLGATQDGVLEGIAAFVPLPHRLAEFRIGDLVFVDDSISTTPEATHAALDAYFGRKIALIAGGFDRQQNYEELATLLAPSGVSHLVVLPETGERLALAAKREAPETEIIHAPDLEEAMKALAIRRAHFNTVLLSPAAPSYNQFKNFAERGDKFTALAHELFDKG